jgi:hypothetical protein
VTQLFKNIYETGSWPKDFPEVTMIALKRKPKSAICSDHHTISLITHVAKLVVCILIRIERKIEDVLGEGQLGFRRGKGTGDAIGILIII